MKTLPMLFAALVLSATAAEASSFGLSGKAVPPTAGDDVHVCIYEGANICEEPTWEIVTPCITTSMLAGQTCPEAASGNKPHKNTLARH